MMQKDNVGNNNAQNRRPSTVNRNCRFLSVLPSESVLYKNVFVIKHYLCPYLKTHIPARLTPGMYPQFPWISRR